MTTLRAEEFDRSEVLLHLGLEAHRLKPLAAIFIGDERTVGLGNRPEETGRGIADRVELWLAMSKRKTFDTPV